MSHRILSFFPSFSEWRVGVVQRLSYRALAATAFVLAIAATSASASAQPITGLGSPQLDAFVAQKMWQMRTPGLAVLVIKNGEVVWSKGYGLANIAQQAPVTPDTVFNVASISKSVTAIAIMQLWEDDAFELDDDVNGYLPFDVRSPANPQAPITFRMLLNHTAGLTRNGGNVSFTFFGQDSPISLGDYLEGLLVPGGPYFSGAVYNGSIPGTLFEYSNVGYALIGYLVETISGVPFPQYCAEHIFAPLGMNDTYWRLDDLFAANLPLAGIYIFSHTTQSYVNLGQNATAGYPSTGLRVSANDLARFLLAHMNGGTFQGGTILQPATVALMHTQHSIAPPGGGWTWGYGFGFEINHSGPTQSQLSIGHGGQWFGSATEMRYRPGEDIGVIVLANSPGAIATAAPHFTFITGREFTIYSFIPERLLDEAAAHQP